MIHLKREVKRLARAPEIASSREREREKRRNQFCSECSEGQKEIRPTGEMFQMILQMHEMTSYSLIKRERPLTSE